MKSNPQSKQQKQTNPLVISVFGLMLTVFGIVDFFTINKLLGAILVIIGVLLGIVGIQKYKILKSQLKQNKAG